MLSQRGRIGGGNIYTIDIELKVGMHFVCSNVYSIRSPFDPFPAETTNTGSSPVLLTHSDWYRTLSPRLVLLPLSPSHTLLPLPHHRQLSPNRWQTITLDQKLGPIPLVRKLLSSFTRKSISFSSPNLTHIPRQSI